MSNLLTPEVYAKFELAVSKWQRRLDLSSYEQRLIQTVVTDYSLIRWQRHFKNKNRDWLASSQLLEEVPLVLMEYLLTPRSVPLVVGFVGNRTVKACNLQDIEYRTAKYRMSEFRRQFPRVVSYLMQRQCGYGFKEDRVGKSTYLHIQSNTAWEVHLALCITRQVVNELGIELYDGHSVEVLREVYHRLCVKLHRKKHLYYDEAMKCTVTPRRVLAVNLANDILASRRHHICTLKR